MDNSNEIWWTVCSIIFREILQEQVYKTRVSELDLWTTPLIMACRNDNVIQLGPLRSAVVQINDILR